MPPQPPKGPVPAIGGGVFTPPRGPAPTGSRPTSVRPLCCLSGALLGTYEKANSSFRYLPSFNPRRCLTQPSEGVANGSHDNARGDYILYVNETLGEAPRPSYRVIDVLGSGTFGQVVRCTREGEGGGGEFAVKVVKNKPAYFNQGLIEVQILKALNRDFDPDDVHHIVRLVDHFIYRRHLCLVFELLSINLYELIKQNQFRGLSTNLMRVFVAQLLAALAVLERAGIVHCDLKPENVLLESLAAPNVKLIDFGSACYAHQTTYSYIQSRFYRSPEVLFGVPYGPAIDVWSLGCLAAELFLGLPLFPGNSEYDQVRRIVDMRGQPNPAFLDRGKQSLKFFNRRFAPQASAASTSSNPLTPQEFSMHAYELKSAKQFARERNVELRPPKKYFKHNTIPEIIKNYPMRKTAAPADRERERVSRVAFVHFLNGVLELDPRQRWSASEAVHHPFVTGSPLPEDGWSPRDIRSGAATAGAGDGAAANGAGEVPTSARNRLVGRPGAGAEQRRASIAVPMQTTPPVAAAPPAAAAAAASSAVAPPKQSALTAAVATAGDTAATPKSGLATSLASGSSTSGFAMAKDVPMGAASPAKTASASATSALSASFAPSSSIGAARGGMVGSTEAKAASSFQFGFGSKAAGNSSSSSSSSSSNMSTSVPRQGVRGMPASPTSPPMTRTEAIPVHTSKSARRARDPSMAKSPGSFFRTTAATDAAGTRGKDISAFAGTPASLTSVSSFFDPSGMSYPPRRPSSPSLTPQTRPGQFMSGLGAGVAASVTSQNPGTSAPSGHRLSIGPHHRLRGNTLTAGSSGAQFATGAMSGVPGASAAASPASNSQQTSPRAAGSGSGKSGRRGNRRRRASNAPKRSVSSRIDEDDLLFEFDDGGGGSGNSGPRGSSPSTSGSSLHSPRGEGQDLVIPGEMQED